VKQLILVVLVALGLSASAHAQHRHSSGQSHSNVRTLRTMVTCYGDAYAARPMNVGIVKDRDTKSLVAFVVRKDDYASHSTRLVYNSEVVARGYNGEVHYIDSKSGGLVGLSLVTDARNHKFLGRFQVVIAGSVVYRGSDLLCRYNDTISFNIDR